LVSRFCTTTVIRLSLKCVRAMVGPRPVYSLRSRTTRLLMARPCEPVVVGSNRALGMASSVLASLLRAESRERGKETDEIRRATRLSRRSPVAAPSEPTSFQLTAAPPARRRA
jgi:hypothetical protein